MDMQKKFRQLEVKESIFGGDCRIVRRDSIVKLILLNIVPVPVLLFCIFFTLKPSTIPICIALLTADIVLSVIFAVRESQRIRSFEDSLAEMADDEFRSLCSQMSKAEMLYGGFYVLENHLYIPSELLLIPYKEMDTVYASFVRYYFGIKLMAVLRITLKNRKTYKILAEPRGIHQDYSDFIELLNSKKAA